MLSLSGSLTFANTTYANVSCPWDWILRPEMIAYWYETSRASKLRRMAMLAVLGYLLLHVSVFVILSPVFSWWAVPFLP